MSKSKSPDIRWKQRLKNYSDALAQLKVGVQTFEQRPLSPLEEQGLIQAFEFTHELAWNVIKDYFDHQGSGSVITGSRDAAREAFRQGLLNEGEIWMEMIRSRNQTSHTYNKNVAKEIVEKIVKNYFHAFEQFQQTMTTLSAHE